MPERLWSVTLDGDSFGATMFVDSRGRVVVSTTASKNEARPAGLRTITTVSVGSTPTHANFHAHYTHVIEPDGRTAWSVPRIHVRSEAPDGTYVAIDERERLVVLNEGGRQLSARDAAAAWTVIGWDDGEPIIGSGAGCWVAPHVYTISSHQLCRHDRTGKAESIATMPSDLFEAQCRNRPKLESYPSAVLFPSVLDLAYQPKVDRFIAWFSGPLAWAVGMRTDGFVEWVRLLDLGCCNTGCFVGDTFLHASSCGSRLTFLSNDGAVIKAHDVQNLLRPLAAVGFACAIATDALHAFDERGEPLWKIDVPDLALAAATRGVVYTLSGDQDTLRLSAFAT